MTESEKDAMLRKYAAGDIAWSALREMGFDNYLDVLAGLGERGLRPPVAPMEGPLKEAREKGRAFIKRALEAAR